MAGPTTSTPTGREPGGLFERTAETGEPAVRAWTPHRQVAFGRRDSREDGYEAARRAAADHDFPAVERQVGGRAVAYTGDDGGVRARRTRHRRDRPSATTARPPTSRSRSGDLGVDARPGEPPDSFCPGSHSLQADGKIAGLAQRVTGDAALVAGIVLTRDAEEIATYSNPSTPRSTCRSTRKSWEASSVPAGRATRKPSREQSRRALVEGYDETTGDREA